MQIPRERARRDPLSNTPHPGAFPIPPDAAPPRPARADSTCRRWRRGGGYGWRSGRGPCGRSGFLSSPTPPSPTSGAPRPPATAPLGHLAAAGRRLSAGRGLRGLPRPRGLLRDLRAGPWAAPAPPAPPPGAGTPRSRLHPPPSASPSPGQPKCLWPRPCLRRAGGTAPQCRRPHDPPLGFPLGCQEGGDSFYQWRPSLGKVSGGVKGQSFLVGTFSSQEIETQAILSAVSADITNHTSLGVVLGSLHKDSVSLLQPAARSPFRTSAEWHFSGRVKGT